MSRSLPRTSVFHNRVNNSHRNVEADLQKAKSSVDNSQHDVDAELQKAKDSIKTLVKVVAFMAVLGVLIIGGVAGIVAKTMTNQRNSENKDDALALSLENQHVTLQEQQNNTEKQLEAFGDMMRTIESKLQASVEQQNISDIDRRLDTLNTALQIVQNAQNMSDIDTRLDTLNTTVQIVQNAQNMSDIDRRLETRNTTVQIVQNTQNISDIDTRLDTLNTTVQIVQNAIDAVQEKQNTPDKDQQVAFTAHSATGKLVNTVLTFRNVDPNLGGGYDQTTGAFTCPVNGTYLFSATLVSVIRSSQTWCHIRKNRSSVVIVYSREGSFDSASVSALVHLSVGDIVDLGGCRYVHYINKTDGWTSFTGSLIQAD